MNTPEEKLEAKEARVTELECKLYDADMGWSKQRDRIAALEAELAAKGSLIFTMTRALKPIVESVQHVADDVLNKAPGTWSVGFTGQEIVLARYAVSLSAFAPKTRELEQAVIEAARRYVESDLLPEDKWAMTRAVEHMNLQDALAALDAHREGK